MSFPHPNAPGAALAIDEARIERLVADFYASVRVDPLLGPIFEGHITDWPDHLAKLCRFWSSVTLLTGAYKGTPLQAHLALDAIGPAHFERWLALFDAATRRQCTPEQAALFMDRARRIAQSFTLALAQQRGELPLAPAMTR